jgi:predicted outer membrane repeat protein
VAHGSGDYHLQVSSPVIDRCVDGEATDFDGEARPIVRETAASPYDMGADEVSGVMRVGLNGSGCAYATVQQAVNAATDGDTLRMAEGVYFENVYVAGRDITLEGGYDSSCTAAGTDVTRIDGSVGTGSTMVVDGSTVLLRGLELAWGQGSGGGLFTTGGAAVTLEQTTIRDNHGDYGGGIYVSGGTAVTLTNDSDVIHNTASGYGGGARVWGSLVGAETTSDISDNCAAHGGGVSISGGVLTLDGSDMEGNEAADAEGEGGGIHAEDEGSVALLGNAWVYHGTAYDGAGAYLDGSTLDLADGVLGGNAATHDGGGAYLTNDATLTGGSLASIGWNGYPNTARYGGGVYLENSSLDFAGRMTDNAASAGGGGIAALDGSTLTIRDAALQRNTAEGSGGGIYAQDGTVHVNRTRMDRNTARWGGAFFQTGAASVADLHNTLIYSNTATARLGAGIRSAGGIVTMTHTTLAHNVNGAGYSQENTEGFAVNSIAWGNEHGGFWVTSGTLSGECSLDQTENAGPALNPQFIAPGEGEDYHLDGGSPAVDRCSTGLAHDLDGVARPIGEGYDAGAYEYGSWDVYLPLTLRGY